MRRVMILGSPGSGKSTLARRLGQALGLPVFHLDQLFHQPDWQPSPPDVFIARVVEVAALPEWIIDGNYSGTAGPRLAAADTIIYLDVPRWLAMVRVIRRAVLGYGRQRIDAAAGCRERIDPEFFLYVWRWHRDVEPRVRAMMTLFPGDIVEIRSRGEARRLAASLLPAP